VKRREFITLVGGAAATVWPHAARAQQAERMRRIGMLIGYLEQDADARTRVTALLHALQTLGWVEGRNIHISYGYAGSDGARLRAAAQALVAAAPDVIVVQSNPAVIALREANRTIPTVFVQVGDPVGSGFVEGLARPGGNLTGFSTSDPEMGGKWLELLKEVAPATNRVAVILDPEIKGNMGYLPSTEAAASIHKIAVSTVGVRDASEIERAVTAVAREPHGALMVLPNPLNGANRELIARLAATHLLPSIYAFRPYVASGGLLSYGPDPDDLFRRAASYVDRILRGAKPSELPVQAPVKFELVINLKTAKALGLDVPLHLQQLADEVIE
jgi:putative ABC transport system substrate-binding protein